MSIWKLASLLPKFRIEGKVTSRGVSNPRVFVTATRPSQEKAAKEKKEAYKRVQEAADAWQDTATTVKKAAQDVTKGTKAVTKAVCGAVDKVTEMAKESVTESLGDAAKKMVKEKFLEK